jgi:hypothetical protein
MQQRCADAKDFSDAPNGGGGAAAIAIAKPNSFRAR